MNTGTAGNAQIIAGTTRFASYIENRHETFLDVVKEYTNVAIEDSPYDDYEEQLVDEAFLGTGYTLLAFPSLYDMFGSFMAGFDIELVWSKAFTNLYKASEVSTVEEESAVRDEIETKSLPEFAVSMRNLNAVHSSSFVMGKTSIELTQFRLLARYSTEEKFNLLPQVNDYLRNELNWQRQVRLQYTIKMKLYYLATLQKNDADYIIAAQNKLWPFLATDFERAALAAMRAETTYTKVLTSRSRSDVSKALLISSYTATGAAIGGWVGGAIGFVVGIAAVLFE